MRERQTPPTVKPVGEGKGQGTKATENVGHLDAGGIGKSAWRSLNLVHVTITTYQLEILALSLKITFRVSPSRPTIEHGIVWVLHVVRRGFVYLWLSCNPSEYQ